MTCTELTRVWGTDDADGAPAHLSGKVLGGRFLVGSVIGLGGSSTVYSGWHQDLDCPVAIKVLNRATPNDAMYRYFLREAAITARLSNPHVVHVYDRGTLENGTPFAVFEQLRGQTLQAILEEVGHLPCSLAVDLALQVCLVLIDAHARGIAHCDLKPENLFLTVLPDGSRLLKVIDFGTARGEHTPECVWSACVGTPGYMAPEQVENPEQVDHRADIWGIGVVLYRMLSGVLPFPGSRQARMFATVNEVPQPLSTRLPSLPAGLEPIVGKCLTKDPSARYQSAKALASALRSLRSRLDDTCEWDWTQLAPPLSGVYPAPQGGTHPNSETMLSVGCAREATSPFLLTRCG